LSNTTFVLATLFLNVHIAREPGAFPHGHQGLTIDTTAAHLY